MAGCERLRDNRRMTDAAHNQHSETCRPSDRDRVVTTGPSRFQPARPEVLPEMMSVSVEGTPKNRCRTTKAERIVETRAELPFIGDQIVCLSHDQAARSATRQKMGQEAIRDHPPRRPADCCSTGSLDTQRPCLIAVAAFVA